MTSSFNRLVSPGRTIFAVGMFGLGVLCILSRDFIVGRPPAWSFGFDPNPFLGIVSGITLLGATAAILANKNAGWASFTIAILIFLFAIPRELPLFMNDWLVLNAYKSAALLGGALIVGSSFFNNDATVIGGITMSSRLRNRLVMIGAILLALFFVACGYAHFKFAEFVTNFIPAYIPFREFWAYFCGICLFAGGVGLLLPRFRGLAALLSAVMVLGWFFLLHIPRFLANVEDPSDRLGLCESFAFGGIFLTLAGLWKPDNRNR